MLTFTLHVKRAVHADLGRASSLGIRRDQVRGGNIAQTGFV